MQTDQENFAAETKVAECYQCGKCTAGCPMAERMDVMPNQILRLVQLGQEKRAMACGAVWLCVACQTCTARCPQSVDPAGVMDALRQASLEAGTASPSGQRTVTFQKAFLDNIRRNGRLNELELVGQFKTQGFLKDFSLKHLMADSLLAPRMLARGKLHFVPARAGDRGIVRRIFDKCRA
jgi:heterodisulfide reductase subunit C2